MVVPKSKTGVDAKPEYKRTPREEEVLIKLSTPRVKVSKEGTTKYGPDHPNNVIGTALLMEALGTTDLDFYKGFLPQLANASGGEIDEQKLNFLLSVVKGIKPRDQIEAMLAGQMAAVHAATMAIAGSLAEAKYLEHRDSAERAFSKLARTFMGQMEALKRYRTGGEQTVTVQHVNVSEGGQAIVGNVTQGQRERCAGQDRCTTTVGPNRRKNDPNARR